MEYFSFSLMLFFLVLLLAWSLLIYVLYFWWWKPVTTRLKLRKQGIKGPPPTFILGNIPEMKKTLAEIPEIHPDPNITCNSFPTVFPYFMQWTNRYGKDYVFGLGEYQVLYVTNSDLVKELRLFRSMDLGKPAYLQKERGALLGKGLMTTNCAVWAHQRKTLGPQFYMDKVKDLIDLMAESGSSLVQSWERLIESGGGIMDITIDDHVRSFTFNIISKMVFGKDHEKGMKIFPKCRALINATGNATTLGIPFMRFFPTKGNSEAKRLAREVHEIIMNIANKRNGSTSDNHQDMLQVILEGSKTGELGSLTADEYIVDNCKDILLAAFEGTAIAAIWGLMLLASHQEWQDRARLEVMEVCGSRLPEANMLAKMKVLKMVVQEVLRLYPGVAFVSRQALVDVKLGKLNVPKGVNIWIWMLALHLDPELWGPDADKFNPKRFANGVLEACKSPHGYIPFGVGARVCPGQGLAVDEMKVLFAMVLSKFKLRISPTYRHSPQFGLLLVPQHGVQLLIEKI